MTDEELLVPSMPGAEDVTDGSVDHYEMDWPVIDNRALEEEMYKCNRSPAGAVLPARTISPCRQMRKCTRSFRVKREASSARRQGWLLPVKTRDELSF